MIVSEHISLSSFTTFRTGGNARYMLEARSVSEVQEALRFVRESEIPAFVLGGGSNVLALDRGFDGAVILPKLFEFSVEGSVIVAGAGIEWDSLVREAATRSLWGIENLAGIPGTVGAAPIQNIGAYGSEVKDIISFVDALRITDGTVVRFMNRDCGFGYRDSNFKRERGYVILAVGFALSHEGVPNLSYPDLAKKKETGISLATPEEIGCAVRSVRVQKFPNLREFGTAGSFFKNPVISETAYTKLQKRLPLLPGFFVPGGVKISLAHLLDKGLGLCGYRRGSAWLYDKQPLVLVLDADGSAHDVEMLAQEVEKKVKEKTGITIEREVQTLSAR